MENTTDMLKSFFVAPIFEGDEEKTRAAELVNTMLLAQIGVFVLALVALLVSRVGAQLDQVIAGLVFLALLFALLIPLRRGYVAGTGIAVLVLLTVMTGFSVAAAGTIREPVLAMFLLASIFAGLALGRRAAVVSVIINILIVTGIAYGEMNRLLPPPESSTNSQHVVLFAMAGILTVVLLNQALRRIDVLLKLANVKQYELADLNKELNTLNLELEQRVADRTKALTSVAAISTETSTINDIDKMLHSVVQLTQRRFGLYHAHIFIYDENTEALKVAACGYKEGDEHEGTDGTAMIPIVQEKSLVARTFRIRQAVIVNDVHNEPGWLANPLLPDTASEMAVPLIAGDQILGVLDVQSDRLNAFSDQDANIQTTLASLVATALQNARLYEQAENSAKEAQSLVDYAPEAIVVINMETGLFIDPNANAEKLYGLSHSELLKVGPAQMSPSNQPDGRDSTEKAMEKIGEAMQGGAPVFEWTHRNAQGQDIPCEVRLVRLPGAQPRVRASVTDITERKRFLELTTQRAKQQEALNLITQKIQNTTSVESALQVAARELGHALGMRQTLVSLDPLIQSSDDKGNS